VIRDFNNVLYPEDRIRGQTVTASEVREFIGCMQECELMDIVTIRGLYTWNNRQDKNNRVFTRIDRCMINLEWSTNVEATVTFLPEDMSDRTPILITFQQFLTPSNFKFCEM